MAYLINSIPANLDFPQCLLIYWHQFLDLFKSLPCLLTTLSCTEVQLNKQGFALASSFLLLLLLLSTKHRDRSSPQGATLACSRAHGMNGADAAGANGAGVNTDGARGVGARCANMD